APLRTRRARGRCVAAFRSLAERRTRGPRPPAAQRSASHCFDRRRKMRLFDSRNGESLRAHLGAGLERSGSADFAIRQIRLARVGFMPSELRALKRCRVLLGRLDAETLAPPDAPPAPLRTAALLDLASSGRLEVRSSGLLSWDPDFALLGHEPGTP